MKTIKLLLFSALITCFACDKNNDDTDPIDNMDDVGVIDMNEFDVNFVQNYGATTTRDIMVQVMDTNGNAIAGATISVAETNELTDDQGIAILRDAAVYERFGYIKASKDGFIHASRSIAPAAGLNQVRIMMLPETVSGTTVSGAVATISNGAGASVLLNGNYIDANGVEYAGDVDVILHHLDPTDVNMPDQMPGMLYAQDADGEEQGLVTLGMLAVELRGAAGQDLNLMDGSTATLTIPLDPSLIANAPVTLPLWYFDEVNGVWIEEGEATLQGAAYVGEVSHFSFWNCDIPTDANVICLVLSDEDGNPLANTTITITSATFGTTSGTTNIDGEVCGYMPSGEVLELNVYNDTCGDSSLFNTNIGPFSSDETVAITVILTGDVITETIVGTLSDCLGALISNGYAVVDYLDGGATAVIGTDGSFELSIIRCTDAIEFSIKGIDIDGVQQSAEQGYSFTTPLTNVGNLLACETITEFIQYDLDTGATTFFTTEDISAQFSANNPQTNGPSVTISAYDDNTNEGIYLYGQLMATPYVGVYDSLDWQDPDDLGFNIEEFFGAMNNDTMEYTLTALGEIGEYIDISFNGTYEDNAGTEHTLTGTVHVLRDN
jgi:hypothetical protein